ncbi:MAG: hypothetical protein UCO70_05375 [Collinsella stercoris]|nr:hypothetical protein [Collinsella stercoris]
MSRLTIDDLDREIAEAEQRRASALEAGWQKGVCQMDKRLKKLRKKRDRYVAKCGAEVPSIPLGSSWATDEAQADLGVNTALSTDVKLVQPKWSSTKLVPYELLTVDGVMRIDSETYSIALRVDDVNYQGARPEDQYLVREAWAGYLDSLDHTVRLGIFIMNKRVSPEEFASDLLFREVPGDERGNVLRREYNAWTRSMLAKSSRSVRRDRIITIAVSADTLERAVPRLSQEADSFLRFMRDLGSDAHVLDGQQRLDIIQTMTRQDDTPGTANFERLSGTVGLTTRELVAPSSVLTADGYRGDPRMIVGRRWVKTYDVTLDGYGKTMKDSFISDLTGLPYDLTVAWHIRPWEFSAAISAAENHLHEITEENNTYQFNTSRPEVGYFVDQNNMPPAMREAQEDAEAFRDDLESAEMHAFGVTTVVTVQGRTETELEEACREVEKVFSTHRKPYPDSWRALREESFSTALPIGAPYIPYERTLTTDPLSHMLMFVAAEMNDPGGNIMGLNAETRSFIVYDPVSHEHTNSFTLAQPRSGKSFNSKITRIIPVHLKHPDDDVITIDPEGEYVTPTEYLGGQVIRIAENSGDFINPLDISLAYGSDDPETKSSPVPAKVSFIQSLVRMMASSVNDAQANVLDAAAAYAYNRYLDDPRPENLPTLQDIYDFLMSEQGSDMRDARDLAKLIRRYVTGTLSLFNHPTNVNLQSNLVCFDLHELSSELKPLALLIILDHIWVRVSANRRAGRRTWLIIDEFQLLLDSPYARSQIDRFFTRGGKWDFYINAITQNLSRVLNSEETRYMFQNSPFVTILQQTSDLLPDFQELFNLSESQTKVLATAHPGEGLYVFKNRVVHFDFQIDSKICPTLYDICTTRPADIKRRAARPVSAGPDVGSLDEPEDDSSSNSRSRREEIGRCVPSPAHMAPSPRPLPDSQPANVQIGFNGGDNRNAVAANNERMEDMDIRDFQEGADFSRFNTRRLPTEEELRAQAEAELKELVLNAINQVFTHESDTHFDDFALALSSAGITLGADPSGDIAFSNGTVALSGSEVGYTLPALVAMSEHANGLDVAPQTQTATAPEQAQPVDGSNVQAGSRSDGARLQQTESPARPDTQAQAYRQSAHAASSQQAPAATFTQPNGMYPNQRAAQRHLKQAAMQAAATPQQSDDQRFTSASVAGAMQGLLGYQNDSGEDLGGMFASPDEISPEGLTEYAGGSGFVG